MSAHTPGPWVAHFEEAYYVTGPDLGRVAMMQNLKGAYGLGGRRSGNESAANARLIAAAPDLLAVCQAQHKAIDILMAMLIDAKTGFMPTKWDQWQTVVDGHATILKATGEPA